MSLTTLLLYIPVRNFDFITLDDPSYVYQNPWVRGGFTVAGLRAAFAVGPEGLWFPLTRLSAMVDYWFFGRSAAGHHLTSVVLHTLATLALYLFLARATGYRDRAFCVAGAFSLHPLHVESVAWIAERKDVLSAFFWFLTLLFWTHYVRKPSRRAYGLSLGAFILGLMSKPMIVTLPLLLVLLDFWPFRRPWYMRLIVEKVPFFLLAVLGAVTAFMAQAGAGAVRSLSQLSLALRVENSLTNWMYFLWATFWPARLSVVYPLPESIPIRLVAVALALLIAISGCVFRYRHRFPYLLVGWLWYLGCTLPVIGLIQVGAAGRADHYMYVPLVGLAIGVFFFLWDGVGNRIIFARIVSAVVFLAMSLAASRQLIWWKDSETLYMHGLSETGPNYLLHLYMARYLAGIPQRRAEAVAAAREAVRINPRLEVVHSTLSTLLADSQEYNSAVAEATTALHIESTPESNFAMGGALFGRGDFADAVPYLREALRQLPSHAKAEALLGTALLRSGDNEAAVRLMRNSILKDSGDSYVENLLGSFLVSAGDRDAGALHLERAISLNHSNAEAYNNLGAASMLRSGGEFEAIMRFRQAVQIKPDYAKAWMNLGGVLLRTPGRAAEAVPCFEEGLRLSPDPVNQAKLRELKALLARAQ